MYFTVIYCKPLSQNFSGIHETNPILTNPIRPLAVPMFCRVFEGVGNLRKCGMRKVICGMNSAEICCGTVGNMRNAE